MNDGLWIVIPNWEKFQHPDVARNKNGVPPWIRVYTELLSKPEFLELSLQKRGLLVSIWIEYARGRTKLRASRHMLARQLGATVYQRDLDALNHAGFITFSASSVQADSPQLASTEERREEKRREDASNAAAGTTELTTVEQYPAREVEDRNGDAAAAEPAGEPARESRIRQVAERYGADLSIILPHAQSVTAGSLEDVAAKVAARVARGNVQNPAGLLVQLLRAANRRARLAAVVDISDVDTLEVEIAREARGYAAQKHPAEVMRELLARKLRKAGLDEREQERLLARAVAEYEAA